MASINPEVESLRKRYANNPEQCNLRINKLYKERGISPMAGCLPMLLQLVFLLAFYGALRSIAAKETMSLVLRAAEHGAEGVQLPNGCGCITSGSRIPAWRVCCLRQASF